MFADSASVHTCENKGLQERKSQLIIFSSRFSQYELFLSKFRAQGPVRPAVRAVSAICRTTQSSHQRTLATTLYGLHKSLYMGEKEAYYARCLEAMRDPEHAMSINTDGMDQFKTTIPTPKSGT